jgi:4-aminobutyrate aminotransferase
MPQELVTALRKICDTHGIVMIADEIQSGFARTGKMFAMEHYGIAADLMTSAKSLAGGLPLSAVTGAAQIMDAPPPGGLGGTYAGNPLAVAAAHAVLDVMIEERLCERSQKLGSQLVDLLTSVQATQPRIADVRGLGSMIAVEFVKPDGQTPDADFAKLVQKRALDEGLLLLTCGTNGNVIRFLYPLTIEETVFNEALKIIARALQD